MGWCERHLLFFQLLLFMILKLLSFAVSHSTGSLFGSPPTLSCPAIDQVASSLNQAEWHIFTYSKHSLIITVLWSLFITLILLKITPQLKNNGVQEATKAWNMGSHTKSRTACQHCRHIGKDIVFRGLGTVHDFRCLPEM